MPTPEENEFLRQLFLKHHKKLFLVAADMTENHMTAEDMVAETFEAALNNISSLMIHPNPFGWLFVTLREIAAPLPEISDFDLPEEILNIRRQLEHTSAADFDESLWNLYLKAIAHLPAQQHFCDSQKDFQQRMHLKSSPPAASQKKPISQRRKFLSIMIAATVTLSFYSLVSGFDFLDQIFSEEETPSSSAETEQSAEEELANYEDPPVDENTTVILADYIPIPFDTMRETMIQDGVTIPMLPTWVPSRFKPDEAQVIVMPFTGEKEYMVSYVKELGKSEFTATARELWENDSGSQFEMDNETPIVYHAGGLDYYIFHNLDQVDAVTYVDNYEIAFWGNVSVKEMKKIVDSVYEGEN